MELDERKRAILRSVVIDYIQTAEPVGSRTIARRYHLGFSPATIRNEMADLEDYGYLEQPHTSAGRIPSDKGYRFFVDELMDRAELTREEAESVRNRIASRQYEAEEVIRESSRILRSFTRYPSVAVAPPARRLSYRYLKLVPLDADNLLLVLVTGPGFVQSRLIRLENMPAADVLLRLSADLTAAIKNQTAGELSRETMNQIRQLVVDPQLLDEILLLMEQPASNDMSGFFLVEGATAILEQPEFRDLERARAYLALFEGGNTIMKALEKLSPRTDDVVVLIGRENPPGPLQDLSIVAAGYESAGEVVGTLGVIGPKRMDYQRAMALVGCVAKFLSESLSSVLRGR